MFVCMCLFVVRVFVGLFSCLVVVYLFFVYYRVDPSARENYAVKWAHKYGHFETVKLLLQHPLVDSNSVIEMDEETSEKSSEILLNEQIN
jgi:hypothetical protein